MLSILQGCSDWGKGPCISSFHRLPSLCITCKAIKKKITKQKILIKILWTEMSWARTVEVFWHDWQRRRLELFLQLFKTTKSPNKCSAVGSVMFYLDKKNAAMSSACWQASQKSVTLEQRRTSSSSHIYWLYTAMTACCSVSSFDEEVRRGKKRDSKCGTWTKGKKFWY